VSQRSPIVVGWKAIAAHLSEVTGLSVSDMQAFRMAQREEDPLPTYPIGRGRRRPRGVRQDELEKWAHREYSEILGAGEEAKAKDTNRATRRDSNRESQTVRPATIRK
jgi:hypothetical protein